MSKDVVYSGSLRHYYASGGVAEFRDKRGWKIWFEGNRILFCVGDYNPVDRETGEPVKLGEVIGDIKALSPRGFSEVLSTIFFTADHRTGMTAYKILYEMTPGDIIAFTLPNYTVGIYMVVSNPAYRDKTGGDWEKCLKMREERMPCEYYCVEIRKLGEVRDPELWYTLPRQSTISRVRKALGRLTEIVEKMLGESGE